MADADTLRKQRQKQLEDKRRRLEELRKRKKDKVTARFADDALIRISKGEPEKPSSSTLDGGKGEVTDLDAVIKNLINTPTPPQVAEGLGQGRLNIMFAKDVCQQRRTPFCQAAKAFNWNLIMGAGKRDDGRSLGNAFSWMRNEPRDLGRIRLCGVGEQDLVQQTLSNVLKLWMFLRKPLFGSTTT